MAPTALEAVTCPKPASHADGSDSFDVRLGS
jgi:hypothetical protein